MTSTSTKVWTILDIINWGKDYLSKNGISNAKLELEWFLSNLLNCNRIDLYVRFEEPLNPNELDKIRDFIKRRKTHEPFQYILGTAPFYGRDFIVNKNVLIPRPETETIIEIANKIKQNGRFLEIGTGNGCIAVTLLKENIFQSGIAVDISEKAIEIAQQNKTKFEADQLVLSQIDFLKQPINQKFDCIISNPPYISTEEMKSLEDVVIKFEPKIALTDNSDGLSFYRKIATKGRNLLHPNGVMILETGGEQQIPIIEKIFINQNYSVQIHKDQNNENRILEVHLN